MNRHESRTVTGDQQMCERNACSMGPSRHAMPTTRRSQYEVVKESLVLK